MSAKVQNQWKIMIKWENWGWALILLAFPFLVFIFLSTPFSLTTISVSLSSPSFFSLKSTHASWFFLPFSLCSSLFLSRTCWLFCFWILLIINAEMGYSPDFFNSLWWKLTKAFVGTLEEYLKNKGKRRLGLFWLSVSVVKWRLMRFSRDCMLHRVDELYCFWFLFSLWWIWAFERKTPAFVLFFWGLEKVRVFFLCLCMNYCYSWS